MTWQKVAVTGGAGFIGSHLVAYLIKKKYRVLVVDNLFSGNKDAVNKKADFEKIDVRNGKKMTDCLGKFKPDYVFHLAGIMSKKMADVKGVMEVNLLGTVNVLDACVKAGVKKIIFLSSAAVYGQAANFPIKEGRILTPINCYGASKIGAESCLILYSKQYGIDYSVLRFANVYGPGQRWDNEGGVVSIFCKNALLSRPITVYGGGNQTRDFVYIDDAVRAGYLALRVKKNFIANVSFGKETGIKDLAELVQKISGGKIKIKFERSSGGEIIRSCLDNSRIKRLINWRPKVTLAQGVGKTLLDLS